MVCAAAAQTNACNWTTVDYKSAARAASPYGKSLIENASGNLFSSGANQAQSVLGLRWRLFDFGRVDAQIAAARGQKAEALPAHRLTVLRATEDVETAFSALVKRAARSAS
jgi:outer membrane protein TolC